MSDITIVAGDRQIHGWLTDEPPTPSNGYGGWQVNDRPKQAGLTVWQGREPFQMTVPMLLDRDGQSVQDDIHDLDVLSSGTSRGAPPTVRISGAIKLPVHASADWVIQDLSWGDVKRRGDMVIVRQQVTVTLLEFVDDALLAASTTTSRQNGKTVVHHYRVKKGDTLQSIAARELGDAKRWGDIAVLNGLRSSGQLKVGKLLKLP